MSDDRCGRRWNESLWEAQQIAINKSLLLFAASGGVAASAGMMVRLVGLLQDWKIVPTFQQSFIHSRGVN
jgi:hypothetical protein